MANSEQMEMDVRFDQMLVNMKPHVLRLPHKAERQKCALWIKKFCEPTIGVSGRKNRNMYAQLLVHLLNKGSLEGPFIQKPAAGPLPPLPSYTSIYFDDIQNNVLFNTKENVLPDWVSGELGSDMTGLSSVALDPSSMSALGVHDANERTSTQRRGQKVEFMGPSLTSTSVVPSLPPREHLQMLQFMPEPVLAEPRRLFPMSDVDTTASAENTRLGYTSPAKLDMEAEWKIPFSPITMTTSLGSTFRDDPIAPKTHQREIDMQMKMAQIQLQEEKLQMQQKHDANVQQILDRKNNEIEEVKVHYRYKSKEQEDLLVKLDRKVTQLQTELSSVREKCDRQVNSVKKMADDASVDRQQEFETRLHEATAAFEQEKFEQQKQHTRSIQELLDDTNTRLVKMEQQYAQQTDATASVIRELESRVQQLSREEEELSRQGAAAELRRATVEERCDKLQKQLAHSKARSTSLEKDLKRGEMEHAEAARSLKVKYETEIALLRQENMLACVKTADTISDLEQTVCQLKSSVEREEAERDRQLREQEQSHQQEKLHSEHLHDAKVCSLQQEADHMEQGLKERTRRLEQVNLNNEREVKRLTEQLRAQTQEAEQVLECFKQQVDRSSIQMQADVRQQMEAVEADLSRSKELREKQMKQFQLQLADDRTKHDHQVGSLQTAWEQDRGRLVHELTAQRDSMLLQHKQEVTSLCDGARQEVADAERRARERQERDGQVVRELEKQCEALRDDVLQASQTRKQQLMELGLLREEERREMGRQHEAEISQMRNSTEEQRIEMEKKHSSEMEHTLERTNDRLKEIEKEYDARSSKANETIVDQQNTITQMREDAHRQAEESEHRLLEKNNHVDTERRKLKQQHSISIMSLQHDIEEHRGQTRQLQRRLSQQEQEHEEKLSKLRNQHESRLRGLIPTSVRQELEDTIASLRSQVNSLQQRATMLQEELAVRAAAEFPEYSVAPLGGSTNNNTFIGSSLSLKSS